MKNEINTVLNLNEFRLIKEKVFQTEINLHNENKEIPDSVKQAVNDNESRLKDLYNYNGDTLTMPYYQGYYMRMKPKKEKEVI
jgi:hypothetical protein